jgi:hypothetical protein
MDHLKIDRYHYTAMIGVGGVGSGSFFKLMGNQTLGREESRSGVFLDQEDHCKLHIISHYVKSLTGPDRVTFLHRGGWWSDALLEARNLPEGPERESYIKAMEAR